MRAYAANEIRDVVLVGHGGSGKTTLADSILFCARATPRLGRVDDDTSTFDFEPEEHNRKGTVSAASGHIEWKKTKINLIDTSGHSDFLVDTVAPRSPTQSRPPRRASRGLRLARGARRQSPACSKLGKQRSGIHSQAPASA
ncbi:MAG: hypothetical protein EXR72_14535 [Myxococcales bacterium]|nr:hypothetical protein [Myxococcales bacterium]